MQDDFADILIFMENRGKSGGPEGYFEIFQDKNSNNKLNKKNIVKKLTIC